MTKLYLKRMMHTCRLHRETRYDEYAKGERLSRCWSVYTNATRGNEFIMLLWSDDLIEEKECE